MKRISILFCSVLFSLGAMAQTNYKPAIAYYSVIVDSDVRSAFEPLPDENSSNEQLKKYFKDQATALKTGYRTYDAILTDTCLALLKKALSTKNIELGDKLPKEGMFSYTPYDYPQMGLKKAAKTGAAQNYIKLDVKFTYKESFMESSKEPADKSKMTPRVKLSITLADATGKTIVDADAVATASSSINMQSVNVSLGTKTTTGSTYRADESIRNTLPLELFNQTLSEAIAKIH